MTWGVSTAPTYAEVMDALMAQLTTNLGPLFQTYGRRLRTWQELNQLMTTAGGVDQEAIGADVLTQLVESVESVFNQDDSGQGAFTLGGRVSHCWIEGDGVIIPGDIDPDGQGMATLPVSIMIP